jgi:hypothetical protein
LRAAFSACVRDAANLRVIPDPVIEGSARGGTVALSSATAALSDADPA